MTHKQLLAFGVQWNYPFLAIEGRPLRHGKDAYEQATPEQVIQASERIARWNALATVAQLEQAIGIVDKMLTSRGVLSTPSENEVNAWQLK